MAYTKIDLQAWPRAPYYHHYMHEVRCTYSLTVNPDIARTREALRRAGRKVYPALIYLLARCVNAQEAFRYGYDEAGGLVLWDRIHPTYTVFHDDDRTFSSLWTPYHESFSSFHDAYIQDLRDYGDVHAFAGKPDEPPNAFSVSGMPWTHFSAMNLNVFTEGTYLAPIFTIGRYVQQGEALLMPLAIQAHHAVCDGYHIGVFVEMLETLLAEPETWIE